jgi:glycine hydroxymethyltransferase
LEAGNLLCSSIGLPVDGWPVADAGLRFGTQELTRRGMGPDAMERVATLVAAVLVGGADVTSVRREVAALRRSFPTLHFVRHGADGAPAR